MRILLSNDDGYFSRGITALAAALEPMGQVQVVAPDSNKSAASNSLTIRNPLRAHHLNANTVAINGTPADCVHLALTGLYAEQEFDWVISGINNGANLGEDVFYSGTVGAAMEGRWLKYPPIAVSLAAFEPQHYATACEVVLKVMDKVKKAVDDGQLSQPMLLNINVPDVALDDLRGIQICRAGKRYAPEPAVAQKDPRGRQMFWVGGAGPVDDATQGTDFAAIKAHYAAVTPLVVDMTAREYLAPLAQVFA